MSSNPEEKRRASLAPLEPGSKRALRERALAALEAGVTNLGDRSMTTGEYSVAILLEDLRVYQAELELQNEQLRETQGRAEASARRFASLFDSVPVAVMVIENFGQIARCNPSAARLFRLDDRHLRQNFLLRLVERGDSERVAGALQRLFAGDPGPCLHVELRGGDGGTFTGDLHLAAIDDHDGQGKKQFLCAVLDQTAIMQEHREVVRRSSELEESEERLSAVIDASHDAIVGIDEQGKVVVFNPAAATLFECPAPLGLTLSLADFFPDIQTILEKSRDTNGRGPNGQGAAEWSALTRRGRSLTVEITVARGGTGGTTLFVRDVSQRKLAEQHRNMLEMQLLESQKMQAVGTLAGGIAHDFNNMLGAILGNVALAKQETGPETPAWTSLVEIEKASLRARDLVHQILAFSRKESTRRERLSLGAIIEDTLKLVRVALPPGIELTYRIDPELPIVLADSTQIEQALLNLCTNGIHAVKATASGRGTVRVTAAPVVPEVLLCERLGLTQKLYAAICVEDDGAGMTEEVLQHALEPFFTTKPVGQGTGLGLAVVHGVMRTHHGGVQIQSTRGKGSAFTLFFPSALVEVEAPAAEPPRPKAPSNGRGERILYVDDDQALVFLVQRMLTRRGYEVSGFTDPGAALQALREDPKSFHLVITDFNMPGMSGLDVVRAARAIRADLPLVLSSGYVTEEMEAQASAEGVSAVLHKPQQVDTLCDTVQRLVVGLNEA